MALIELFWKGTQLVEHKSKAKNLDKAVHKYYTNKAFKNDKDRIEFLFELYEVYLDEL